MCVCKIIVEDKIQVKYKKNTGKCIEFFVVYWHSHFVKSEDVLAKEWSILTIH